MCECECESVCTQCLTTIIGFLLFLWQHLIIHGIFSKLVIAVLFKEIQPSRPGLITLLSPFKFMNTIKALSSNLLYM